MKKILLFSAALGMVISANAGTITKKQAAQAASQPVAKAVKAKIAKDGPVQSLAEPALEGVELKGESRANVLSRVAGIDETQAYYINPVGTLYPSFIYGYEQGQYTYSPDADGIYITIPGNVETLWQNASYNLESLEEEVSLEVNPEWVSSYVGIAEDGKAHLYEGPTEGNEITLPVQPVGYAITPPRMTADDSEWMAGFGYDIDSELEGVMYLGGETVLNFSEIGYQGLSFSQFNVMGVTSLKEGTASEETLNFPCDFGYINFGTSGDPFVYTDTKLAFFAQAFKNGGNVFGLEKIYTYIAVMDIDTEKVPEIYLDIYEYTEEDGYVSLGDRIAGSHVSTEDWKVQYWNRVEFPIMVEEDGIEQETFVNLDKDVMIVISGWSSDDAYLCGSMIMGSSIWTIKSDEDGTYNYLTPTPYLENNRVGYFGLEITEGDYEGAQLLVSFEKSRNFYTAVDPDEENPGVGLQPMGWDLQFIGANGTCLIPFGADEEDYVFRSESGDEDAKDFVFEPYYDLDTDAKYSGDGAYEWIFPSAQPYNEEDYTQILTVEIDPLPAGETGRQGELIVEIPGCKQVIKVYQGDLSSITSIEVEQVLDENAPMYNVMGQKVDNSYKGIIIQGGRKFINK